jgi:hypothetical protein
VYGAWLWKPTIDTIVKPNVADGWEVDYFGFFQRGPAKRFSNSGKMLGTNREQVPWNASVNEFIRDMQAAGGRVRSLRTTMAKAEANVGPTFAEEPKDHWAPKNCELKGETEEEIEELGRERKSMHEIARDCDMAPHTGPDQHRVEMSWLWLALQGFRSFESYALSTGGEVRKSTDPH